MRANDKSVEEMRKSERIDVTEVVRVIDKPSGQEIGQLVNISEEGIMIMGSQPIAENSIMQLSLVYGDAPEMSIGVESLWSQSGSEDTNYSVMFVSSLSICPGSGYSRGIGKTGVPFPVPSSG